jgi:hypothetical protein
MENHKCTVFTVAGEEWVVSNKTGRRLRYLLSHPYCMICGRVFDSRLMLVSRDDGTVREMIPIPESYDGPLPEERDGKVIVRIPDLYGREE